jgi:Fic family protein
MNDTAIAMAKRLLIDSIWKSANLEGLGTTFPKTEAILSNAPTTTKTEEVLFVINMKRAWQFLFDNISYNNSISLLREYNRIVGELLFDHAGEIRTFPVQIGGTSWEPEMPHTEIIIETLNSIETIEDIELKALKYFCYVVRTQMFVDGNKRVAQLIANKILIENDIGIFQIPIEKLEEFKTLLIKFYETNEDETIINFMKLFCVKHVYKDTETNLFN